MSIQGLLRADNHIEAITPRDPSELVAEVQASFGLKSVHKTARNFIESTAAVSLIKGPFRLRGMGSIDLGSIDLRSIEPSGVEPSGVEAAGGDASASDAGSAEVGIPAGEPSGAKAPAIPMGDFWLLLDSGRVATSPEGEGELDVAQLVAIQTALFAHFGEGDPPRGPHFLRVVAECLGGLQRLARIQAATPIALLGDIDDALLSDMVAADRRFSRVLKQDPLEVRLIDFSHAHLVEVPALDAFENLAAIDLRNNPELDPQHVLEALAPLERLERVDVSLSGWQREQVEALRELLPGARVVDEIPRGAATVAVALKSGKPLRALDLSDLDLRRLPKGVRQLEHLESLDLSGNPKLDFEEVFAHLAALKTLKRIDLRACALRRLPEQIASIESLEEINLACGTWGDHNRLDVSQALPILAELPNLKRLVLDRAVLLPGQWRKTMRVLSEQFTALEQLGMAGWSTLENSGRMFSAEIQQMLVKMGNVRDVSLGSLQLDSMEPTLEELPLTRLDISRNDISTIAPAQLESLTELVARGTSLTSFEGLERCRKLRVIDLRGPRGAQRTFTFPDWLEWLTELRTLRVQNLAFDEVPATIGKLPRLVELALSSKTLTALPDEIGDLSELRRLVLNDLVSGCEQLAELPSSLGRLAKLELLHVSRGGLKRLPESISDCKALRDVELDDLDLADPMETMIQLAQLPALSRLSVTNSGLTRLPESLAEHTGLTDVRLVGKFASYAQAARVICSLPSLERLDLSRFALAGLPKCFSECTSLRALHYETPRTHTVLSPEVLFSALARLPRFEELSIEDIAGHWRELPSSIGDLTRLERLTLTAVGFSTLPKRMARLHNLRLLHLDRCHAIKASEIKRVRRALPECEIRITDW